ncbi:MAG: hypothetical protein AAFP07_22265, partial [Cyanobacteria bacterium J06606_4]
MEQSRPNYEQPGQSAIGQLTLEAVSPQSGQPNAASLSSEQSSAKAPEKAADVQSPPELPDWVRLQKALSVESDRGFN